MNVNAVDFYHDLISIIIIIMMNLIIRSLTFKV
jgi:hypothetical protein